MGKQVVCVEPRSGLDMGALYEVREEYVSSSGELFYKLVGKSESFYQNRFKDVEKRRKPLPHWGKSTAFDPFKGYEVDSDPGVPSVDANRPLCPVQKFYDPDKVILKMG